MKPLVFGISGYSGSGKTTLAEKLIPILKEHGLRVFAVKHDGHELEPDTEGKDSFRLRKAGADTVFISSKSVSARISEGEMPLRQMLEESGDCDIVLVEGYKYARIRKLGIAAKNTGYRLPCAVSEYDALVTDDREGLEAVLKEEIRCPVFDIDAAEPIADFIVNALNKFVSCTMEGRLSGTETEDGKKELTHFDGEGNAIMVDVSEKAATERKATARGRVLINRATFELIRDGNIKKGDVLSVAQIAGIMGAKHTSRLIPLCHPVVTDSTQVRLRLNENDLSVEIEAVVGCTGKTGVEMEAICACSVAAMTVYDMLKAVQRDIRITDIRLVSKTGGIHGDYINRDEGSFRI